MSKATGLRQRSNNNSSILNTTNGRDGATMRKKIEAVDNEYKKVIQGEHSRYSKRRATIGCVDDKEQLERVRRISEGKDSDLRMQSAETVKKAESSFKKFMRRLIFGSIAFAIFRLLLEGGPLYLCLLIVGAQCQIFKELVNVRYEKYKRDKVGLLADVPMFRTLQWFWFVVAMLQMYGNFLKKFTDTNPSLQWVSEGLHHYHKMTVFALFSLAFILSIVTIRPKSLKYQVGHLAWTVVAIVIVVAQMIQAPFMIHYGTFWFFFPAFLVINNDCWAYVCGMLAGKKIINRPFLALSPNKTWEGFIGATIITIAVGWLAADWFSERMEFICPTVTLGVNPTTCTVNDVFIKRDITMPNNLVSLGFPPQIHAKPIQFHGIMFALVASLVAPFGGFMASAIKRANGVKDFASVIPGHGGFTDRLDCQMLMSLYVWVHYTSIVMPFVTLRDRVVDDFTMLSTEDRQYVMDRLTELS